MKDEPAERVRLVVVERDMNLRMFCRLHVVSVVVIITPNIYCHAYFVNEDDH